MTKPQDNDAPRTGQALPIGEQALPIGEDVPLYTVGQVAELLAVKQAFLRRCDELRVVSPQRSAGGQRRYTRVEIRVIQQVVTMTDEGMTLSAIRRIIELEERLALVTRQRDELARRLAELTANLQRN
jgi:MerR family transcriptional regulator/heat shock protein HspR